MSTKKLKKQKCGSHMSIPKNENTDDQKNDVLVLPPDLLQKLGINLENIQSSQNYSLEKNADDCSKVLSNQLLIQKESNFVHSENKDIMEKESSIIETANLMKASVFLSPTFSSSKYNNISESSSETCIEQMFTNSLEKISSEEQNKHLNNNLQKLDGVKCINLQINNNRDWNVIDEREKKTFLNENAIMKSTPNEIISTDTTEESYPSTLSNNEKSNEKENNLTSTQCNENIFVEKHDTNLYSISKECCKISETQIAPNFNDIKITNIELDLVSSTSNSCSSREENFKSTSSTNVNSKLQSPIVMFTENIDKQDNKRCQVNSKIYVPAGLEFKNNIQNKSSHAINNEKYDSLEVLCNTQHKHCNFDNRKMTKDFKTNSSICTINSQHSNLHVDNTSPESRIPLSEDEKVGSNLSLDYYSNQNKLDILTKNINTSKSKDNSKLCIQGVEKPGGDIISNYYLHRSTKTYSRGKTSKLQSTKSTSKFTFEYKTDNFMDYIINEKNQHKCTKFPHNFCVCGDFGNFINYDVDNCYEHIHFRERKEPQCSVETMLSIYEDNKYEYNYEDENFSIYEVENLDEDSEFGISNDYGIETCWNNGETNRGNEHNKMIQMYQNQTEAEFSVSENRKSDHIETISKKKRKRVYISSESESESNVPSAKMLVKCGVCNNNVSTKEWEDHISKKHCYIAWKEGQEIDLQSNDLLVKLSKRLNTARILLCTFCKSESFDVHEFINHVKKCKEQKFEGKFTDVIKLSKSSHKVPAIYKPLAEESVLQVKIDEKKVLVKHKLQVGTQKQTHKVPLLPVEMKAKPKAMGPVVYLRAGEKKTEVSKLLAKEEIVFDVPKLQAKLKENQASESCDLQVKIGEIQTIDDSVLQSISGKEQTSEKISELSVQVETGEENALEVHVSQKTTREISAYELPLIKTGKNHAPKTFALPAETEDMQTFEVPAIQPETENQNITCGVCKNVVQNDLWMDHITREHNYIAWKDDDLPLDCDDEDVIKAYLNQVIKKIGELVCKVCGLKRKFAKSYLRHIKNCGITEESHDSIVDQSLSPVTTRAERRDTIINKEKNKKVKDTIVDTLIKCGVCKQDVINSQWVAHIFKEHDYLAWQEGQPEIDLNDGVQIYDHLVNVKKLNDGLTCKSCGLHRKYVKSYLNHIKVCYGDTTTEQLVDLQDESLNDENVIAASKVDELILELSKQENTKCGVCKMDVQGKQWFNHVKLHHGYLAWKEGKEALDLENDEEVNSYLYFVSKKYKGLICNKCGINRKYVKAYLTHIQSCDSNLLSNLKIEDGDSSKDHFECAVCAKKVDLKDWTDHATKMHYNIAWVVGDYPIDVKNASEVEKRLKEYRKRVGKLKCNICKTTRASLMGFYAHIIQCGKTEEEMDQYKIYCELCDSKYLAIYKSQHANMHRDKELIKQRKLMKLESLNRETLESSQTEQLSERRRAAEKARQFFEKSEMFVHNCSQCGFGADDQDEFDQHACIKTGYKGYVDSEDSAVLESSEDESEDSVLNSNLSEEESNICTDQKRRKRDSSSAARKVPRVPFTVKCAKSFLKQSWEEYRKKFLTSGPLYPQWRSCHIELVPDEQTGDYLPPLNESCKVIIGRSDPVSYNLFEAKKQNGYSVFVGGCIQYISWAPAHLNDDEDDFGHFMAVACHNNVDIPRLDYSKIYEYSGMLQIWDFGDLTSTTPKFAFGIAHEYGTIWALDWCPTGARDVPLNSDYTSESNVTFLRLGLLAVACSNGSAYIFSIPYPSSVKMNDKKVCKLNPVAELRLSNQKHVVSQATSLSWSPQNGSSIVMVGYSNGTIASFNLACDSPLLMETVGGVSIFYPYQDERPHNSCITDVKTFPSGLCAGLMSSVSPTGSEMAQQQGLARVHKHLSSACGEFTPHWPSVMLSGNEVIVNQTVNELDFWGMGRRTGAVQKSCGCLRCGHMATYVPPIMKILTTHPVYKDFNKQPVAVFQMRPLSRKRTKKKNDELQLKLEPLTYDEAVKSYALDFKLMKDLDKDHYKQVHTPREQYPERFPLSDITSMAFYPSQNHHRKLAAATHAGIIFILSDNLQ